MVKCGVLFEVRTEFLNNIYTSFGYKGLLTLELYTASNQLLSYELLFSHGHMQYINNYSVEKTRSISLRTYQSAVTYISISEYLFTIENFPLSNSVVSKLGCAHPRGAREHGGGERK
jgi:hypothetical protein